MLVAENALPLDVVVLAPVADVPDLVAVDVSVWDLPMTPAPVAVAETVAVDETLEAEATLEGRPEAPTGNSTMLDVVALKSV